MQRPERIAPPELFYDATEAGKYTGSSRILEVQAAMARRCLELLSLREGGGAALLLDVGCGSGLSGDVLSEAGHSWVGLDISPAMLDVAVSRGVPGDALLCDMGQGFLFSRALPAQQLAEAAQKGFSSLVTPTSAHV